MSNNWNDPNAPQGDNNQGGWDQQPEQNWDQGQASADQGQQAGGWDQSQASADPNQQAGGWDQNQGAAYGAPGAGAPGYGAPPMAPGANVGPLGMPLASWGKRALGGLLDFVLPGIVISLLTSIIFPANVTSTSGGFEVTQTNNVPSIVGSLLLYLALAFVSQKTGQSWGRKVAKTQLVGEDGQPIGLGKSFVRYIAHFVDSIICLIGWLFPLWDNKRQTLADKIMKTYVLDVSQSGPINVQQ